MIGLQNKNALYAPLLLALLLVFFNSCKEETKTISDTGKDYYPITVGSSFIYTVDSFLYDGINKRIDSSSTVMRDEVVQLLTDSAGENYFLIQRSIQIDSITYDVFLSFASYIYPGSVQSNLYNSREVRMSFPITAFKNWDGNLYNNKAFEEFTYENIQEAFEVNGQVFDNTVTVLQKEFYEPKPPLQPLFDIYRKEVFAKGIGMIYRIDRDLDLQDDSGYEIIYKLKDYSIK